MEAEFVPIVYGTLVALVPPLVAIILALITKEVYSSIFVGILAGGVLYSLQGTLPHVYVQPVDVLTAVFDKGIVSCLTEPDKVGVLVFLVFLGIIVALMNKAGGSAAQPCTGNSLWYSSTSPGMHLLMMSLLLKSR